MSINGHSINGAEALDEEAYQLWLRDPSAPCIHLVELDYGGSYTPPGLPDQIPVTYTLKLSDYPFPPYRDVVQSIPSFDRRIGDDFSGLVSAGIGELVIKNMGDLDAWLNLNISGRSVRTYHGHPSWPAERFRRTMSCIAEIVSAADEKNIHIRLRGNDHRANLPLHTTLIAASSNANGVVPLAYGTVFNAEPKLTDSATSTYQWHDGAVSAVSDVRDSGFQFGTNQDIYLASIDAATNTFTASASHGFYINTRVRFIYVALGAPPEISMFGVDYWVIESGLTATNFKVSATRGGTEIDITGTNSGCGLVGYHWTADLSTGEILLDSKPSGQLTLDGSGHAAGGFVNLAADLVPLVLGETSINLASQSAFRSTCPQPLGLYARDRRNRLDVAADLVRGIGAWYGYDRMGRLIFGRVGGVYTTLNTLREEEMISPMTLERMVMPRWKHRVKYKKNWTVQKSGLASAISEENQALYAADASYPVWTEPVDPDTNGPDDVLLAEIPNAIESMIVQGADAVTESQRLDDLFFGYAGIFNVTIGRIGYEMEIGQALNVVYSRYGFDSGKNGTVIGIQDRPTDGAVDLRIFVPLGTYTPGQL